MSIWSFSSLQDEKLDRDLFEAEYHIYKEYYFMKL